MKKMINFMSNGKNGEYIYINGEYTAYISLNLIVFNCM